MEVSKEEIDQLRQRLFPQSSLEFCERFLLDFTTNFSHQHYQTACLAAGGEARERYYELSQPRFYIQPTHLIHILTGDELAVVTVNYLPSTYAHSVAPETHQSMIMDKGSYHQSYHFNINTSLAKVELYRQMLTALTITTTQFNKLGDGSVRVLVQYGKILIDYINKKKRATYVVIEQNVFISRQDWADIIGLPPPMRILRDLASSYLRKQPSTKTKSFLS